MGQKTRFLSLSIAELSSMLGRKKISPCDLASEVIDRIEESNRQLNAYVYVDPEAIRQQARQAERAILRGAHRGPLHGIPISLKDNIFTAGIPTRAGSKILSDFVPSENAAVVKRLGRAGAMLVGKTNLSEFAYGSETANSYFGRTLNPWDTHLIPGGSSGGSTAAVAALMCSASIGTDTGGSIRIPSALCGVVGLKPTFGRVSCNGVVPLSPSLDHVGPIGRRVLDVAIILHAIAGHDDRDEYSIRKRVPDYFSESKASLRKPRIGIPKEYFFDHLHPEVDCAIKIAVQTLQKLGGRFEQVSLPHMAEAIEFSTHFSYAEATHFHQSAGYFPARAADYASDVRERLELGARVLATEYLKAMGLRKLACKDFERAFEKVDAILVPTVPIPAPHISDKTVEYNSHRESVRSALIRLNRPANITGLPAITIPCGFTRTRLPIGMQIIGRAFEESTILKIAHSYEEATEWHLRRPGEL